MLSRERNIAGFYTCLLLIASFLTLAACDIVLYNPFMKNTYKATTAPPPLNLAHWMCDEESGTSLADATGNGHTGILYGTASWTSLGKNNYALAFDGASGSYVGVPSAVSNTTDFTFAAWVYWNGDSIWQRIFDFGQSTSVYMFLIPSSDYGTIRFAITTGGLSGETQLNISGALPTGTWHHLAVTFSGTVGKIYLNGTLKMINETMENTPAAVGGVNYLSKSQNASDPYFNGRLDDIRIYNYALSAEQIAGLYTMYGDPAPAPAPAALVFSSDKYYKLCNFHGGQALAVDGSSTADLANIVTWTNSDTRDDLKWKIVAVGGFYRLENRNGKVAEVDPSLVSENNANIRQNTDTGADHQLWSIGYVGSGNYKLINKASGKAMVTYNHWTTDGTNVNQFSFRGKVGHMWAITETLP